jgi:dihydroorotase
MARGIPQGGKSLIVVNARLVDRDMDCPGALLVKEGKIAALWLGSLNPDASQGLSHPFGSQGEGLECIDAQGKVLMPAFVDLHAHFRDPGYTKKESLETACKAASAGGYGTVVLMANTQPVISDQEAALEVRARGAELGMVDLFQSVSLTRSFDGADTSGLDKLDSALVPLATEDGKDVASASVMLEGMKKCAARKVIVSCHCEDPALALLAKPLRDRALKADPRVSGLGLARDGTGSYSTISPEARSALEETESILGIAENTMTVRNLFLAREAGCRVHIAHVSTAYALEAVRVAKRECPQALGVTCEVTPHHLALSNTTPAIVNPPLRSEKDRLSLIAGCVDGTVDAIATDHAPHTNEDKAAGAPGFSGIQIAFPLCNTVLVKGNYLCLSKLSALMSANPASILGLDRGLLRPGWDADLVLVDPDETLRVSPDDPAFWQSRSVNTPFGGATLQGKIVATWKSGNKTFPLS